MSQRATTETDDRRASWLTGVDGLRAVSFVLIVFGHAAAVLAFVPHSTTGMAIVGAALALTRFALPAFMTMSAILIAYRIGCGDTVDTARSLSRLAVPYVVWTVFYLGLTKIVQGGPAESVGQLTRELVVALVTGSGFYHLWYVVVAIQIVIFTPPLARGLMRLSSEARLGVFGLAVAGNIVLLGQVSGPITDVAPWTGAIFGGYSDRIVLFWAAFVVGGTVVGLEYERIMALLRSVRPWILVAYGVTCVGVVVLVVAQASRVAGDYQAVAAISRVMQPWIVLFELLAIAAWLMLSEMLMAGRAKDVLSGLSAVSFGGYLVHPLWILVATQRVFSRVLSPQPLVLVAALSAFALAASYLTVVWAGAISMPVGDALFGATRRSRKADR